VEQPAGQSFSTAFGERGIHRVKLHVECTGASQEREVAVTVGQLVALTVTLAGDPHGAVTAPGLSCNGRSCTGTYEPGTAVTLSASPGDPTAAAFAGWTGCATPAATTCTVTMDKAGTVTATFRDLTPPVPSLTGGGQTVTIGSGDRDLNLRGASTTISLTATATDDGSAVTRTEIWRTPNWLCITGSGSLIPGNGNIELAASAAAGRVTYTLNAVNVPTPCGPGSRLWSATYIVWTIAASEGGRSGASDALVVHYVP
jgi:hypothetical protein